FALARPVVVQGNFADILRDSENGLSFNQRGAERISYKVWSDVGLPEIQKLKQDNNAYSGDYKRYLQLPQIDARIPKLAEDITKNFNNRYDKAKAVEEYLQTQLNYTLDLKVGGDEPLADFLFNVREGHCEYFASSMAIMLRTQGIATRIVNGFQQGEYNETADIYVVKQRNAHSWVEVYFPSENVWVPFDPTPFAGQNLEANSSTGILGKFNNYIEALETFWIEYFVGYDNQGQRSLMNSVKNGFFEYQNKTTSWFGEKQEQLAEWWNEVRGEKGLQTSVWAIGIGIGYVSAFVLCVLHLIWFVRKLVKMQLIQRFFDWLRRKNEKSIVLFYEQMQKVLANKGFKREAHQTPLEFAFALNMPEAVKITEKYNRVRFGEKNLSTEEVEEIETWLKDLESKEK
ncbi:MAG TPA: transglutaminase domain-containing protein, partial [Pyrinomonadaceae bacterium]|nr:transglutaminase domain-containing protein [Pyrinomonadaceae bacterium]